MIVAVADTHAIIWYMYRDRHLSSAARETMELAAHSGEQIGVSAISLVEVVYLIERGRIPSLALSYLTSGAWDSANMLRVVAVDQAIVNSMRAPEISGIPEMPDRLIAAIALWLGAPLITRDQIIRTAQIDTIW